MTKAEMQQTLTDWTVAIAKGNTRCKSKRKQKKKGMEAIGLHFQSLMTKKMEKLLLLLLLLLLMMITTMDCCMADWSPTVASKPTIK